MKFWQGKFNEGQSSEIKRYLSTYSFDKRLYKHDVMGSIAHCTMLGEQGIISAEEAAVLRNALTQIFYDITAGKLAADNEANVFDFLDGVLCEKVGEIGKKINIARTPSDRFALDMRMYADDAYAEIMNALKALVETLIGIAEKNYSVIMPTSYRGIKGQPTTLAHTLTAFAEAFVRDIERLSDAKVRASVMPLYSAYGTGVRYNVNRKRVAELLKLSVVSQNSLDALTDIDYVAEFVSATSLISAHILRACRAYLDWNKNEFVIPDPAVNVDSALLPSQNVPAVLETLISKSEKLCHITIDNSALTGSVYYTQSIYDCAETFFGAEAAIKSCIDSLASIVLGYSYNEQAMLKAATNDFAVARDCVDYLIDKGADIDDAYDTVGKLCEYCAAVGKRLDTIDYEIYAGASNLFENDIIPAMRLKNATRLRKHDGEPGEVAVRAEIRTLQRKLKKLFA